MTMLRRVASPGVGRPLKRATGEGGPAASVRRSSARARPRRVPGLRTSRSWTATGRSSTPRPARSAPWWCRPAAGRWFRTVGGTWWQLPRRSCSPGPSTVNSSSGTPKRAGYRSRLCRAAACARGARPLATRWPAYFVAFAVLQHDGQELLLHVGVSVCEFRACERRIPQNGCYLIGWSGRVRRRRSAPSGAPKRANRRSGFRCGWV